MNRKNRPWICPECKTQYDKQPSKVYYIKGIATDSVKCQEELKRALISPPNRGF